MQATTAATNNAEVSTRKYVKLSSITALVALVPSVQNMEGEINMENLIEQVISSPTNLLIFFNFMIAILILVFDGVVWVFFGRLRAIERTKLNRSFTSIALNQLSTQCVLFYSDYTHLIRQSICWAYGIVFFSVILELAKQRCAHLMGNPTTPRVKLYLMVLLLVLVTTANVLWAQVWRSTALLNQHMSLTLLVLFGTFQVQLSNLRLMVQLVIHFIDLKHGGEWEEGNRFSFLADFGLHLFQQTCNLFHQFHLLAFDGFSISIVDLIVVYRVRRIGEKVIVQGKKLFSYRRVIEALDTQYADATGEELAGLTDEVCAICLKSLQSAKKLPCGHFYHGACLRQCFSRPSSSGYRCPICRQSIDAKENDGDESIETAVAEPEPAQAVFRIGSEQFPTWLPVPQFSFEIVRSRGLSAHPIEERNEDIATVLTSTVPVSMITQVEEIFPQYPREVIIEDLERTRSADFTIERILAGHVNVD